MYIARTTFTGDLLPIAVQNVEKGGRCVKFGMHNFTSLPLLTTLSQ